MNGRKGMSQAIWIVVTIVVALAVAMIVIVIVSSTLKKGESATTGPLDIAATTVEIQTCQRACDSCKQLYGDTECTTDKWSSIGEKCIDKNIPTDCD